MNFAIRALSAAVCAASLVLAGCGTTGLFDEAPDASYIMITEGEVNGSFTNTEVKGCKVTFGGHLADLEDVPFNEFEYTESGCVLRSSPNDRPD